ncbi:MAG: hypothetical protein WBY44_07835 [Bryobacteraceae bacterium]|jgi:hypothetical protein
MREIRTSGLMSGVGKRAALRRQCSRPASTLPAFRRNAQGRSYFVALFTVLDPQRTSAR